MTWAQNYDPLHNTVLSTAIAAVPILLLLVLIATNKVKTYWAALIALLLTLAIAVYIFTMPAEMAAKSATLGAVNGTRGCAGGCGNRGHYSMDAAASTLQCTRSSSDSSSELDHQRASRERWRYPTTMRSAPMRDHGVTVTLKSLVHRGEWHV